LETITSEDLLHVIGLFPLRSQKRARAALASMFKWAILWAKVDRNPDGPHPTMRQAPGRYVEVFTETEVATLTSLPELRDRALTTVLLDAGLRKAEARHLQAGRCLLEARQLVVVGGKGEKDRVVPMKERLATVLADLFLTDALEPEHYIWYARKANQYGKRLTRSHPIGEGTFHRWWESTLADAGVPYRNAHTARHTFATSGYSVVRDAHAFEGDGPCLNCHHGRSLRPLGPRRRCQGPRAGGVLRNQSKAKRGSMSRGGAERI
jgi:integrase